PTCQCHEQSARARPVFIPRSSSESGHRCPRRLHAAVGTDHHSSLQRRWHRRRCVVSLCQVRGTPRKFLADTREQIAEVALSSPTSLIGMNRWSLPKLREYLVQQPVLNDGGEPTGQRLLPRRY